jgi:hypothetical protein
VQEIWTNRYFCSVGVNNLSKLAGFLDHDIAKLNGQNPTILLFTKLKTLYEERNDQKFVVFEMKLATSNGNFIFYQPQ